MKSKTVFLCGFLVLVASGCGTGTSLTPLVSSTLVSSAQNTQTPLVTVVPSTGDVQASKIDGMEMVYVPAGEFLMGNDRGATYERPEHSVYLDGYWIDKTEVTNKMFLAFLSDAGDKLAAENGVSLLNYVTGGHIHKENDQWSLDSEYENHPVVNVTWYGASYYCSWANRSLPTEAQWEKAARGTDGRLYPWGNNFDCHNGNFDDETVVDAFTVQGGEGCDRFPETAPVGSFPGGASSYGALDMAGNVWEWTNTQYDYGFNGYDPQPAIIPTVMTTDEMFKAQTDGSIPLGFMDELMEPDQYRFIRGGSWFSDETTVETTTRDWDHIMESTYKYLGFRCSQTP